MSNKHFTHLHLHTDYSLLDGAITIDKLIEYGKKYNSKALAISDHGNIFAAVKFFEKCKKNNIKPIIGMEAYITDNRFTKNINNRYYHLLLLVQDEIGYKNLCKLISYSYMDGFYFKPRIDYEILEKYNKGIVATSTCVGGHIPSLLLENREEEALTKIKYMQQLFEDRYYLEVQPPNFDKQKTLNQKIFELEHELKIPLIATGDCHYATFEDRYAHEVMLAIQTRTTMDDPNRMTFGECLAYMQSPDEMLNIFNGREDIVWRTGEIADRCNFEFQTGKLFFPEFPLPKEQTHESFFKEKCIEGFENLCNTNRFDLTKKNEYFKRLEFEMDMIAKTGFVTYFLIVSDFIKWAKRNNIAVGPGRGSAAGSVASWCLEITDIDPVKYNLLFERFLNPERITMPDIDIDFCIYGREKVIEYVKQKYGHDRVGQIITFGTMMAKGVIKDVARALGIPFEDANHVTDLIPQELKITLEEALKSEPKLQALYDKNPKIKEVIDIAKRLEGTTRHASKHAAGIVISPEPIADVLPIYVPSKTNEIVTQYAMTELETLGFLKMDFLGLKNLTLITDVLALIKKTQDITIDIIYIPLDDQKTFDLLCKGNSLGVFQLEGDGLRDVLRRLKPQTFEDIIAVNALYRPGPLGSGMVDDFIERRHGRQHITYIFPELEDVLKETYGIIVYQEQVMKIASVIGGYSLGEADILRRAMGKKKAEVMAEQKEIFVSKSVQRNFNKKKAEELFDLMAYFAGYGFNKSHSAAYGLIAYQTAYLKANYPLEFMCSLINLELGSPETFVDYIQEARSMNIQIIPPSVQKSEAKFFPINNTLQFGLLGIKNLGENAVNSIIESRKKKEFVNFIDFCSQIDLRVCNKRVLENLILSGAVDCFEKSRAQKLHNLEMIMKRAEEEQDKNTTGQTSLFSMLEDEHNNNFQGDFAWEHTEEWTSTSILEKEKEVLGIYLSEHPLDSFEEIKKLLQIPSLSKMFFDQSTIILGHLTSLREITTKKGDLMAFGILEDKDNKCELIFFPTMYKKYMELLNKKDFFLVIGDSSESNENKRKMKVQNIFDLENFEIENHLKEIIIEVTSENIEYVINFYNNLEHGSHIISFKSKQNKEVIKYTSKKKVSITKNFLKSMYKNETCIKSLLN